ncbi:MAG: hypothetical protein RL724_1984, partial [Pseudomonadota bacterium]
IKAPGGDRPRRAKPRRALPSHAWQGKRQALGCRQSAPMPGKRAFQRERKPRCAAFGGQAGHADRRGQGRLSTAQRPQAQSQNMPAPNQHPRANSPIASKRLLLIPALSTPVIRITPSCPCGQGSRGLRWPAPAASAAGENSGGIAWRMEPPRGIAPHDVQPPGLEPRPWRWLCDFAGERPFLLAGAARGARKSKPLWPWPPSRPPSRLRL